MAELKEVWKGDGIRVKTKLQLLNTTEAEALTSLRDRAILILTD